MSIRFTVMTELSREQPRLKLLDTESVLTFHFPKRDPHEPNDKSDAKFELTAGDCESKISPTARTFDGLVHITDRYWDVRSLGSIDSDDSLVGLKLRAGELMKDLSSNKGEARTLYQAIVMRKRLQLQFRVGEFVKPSVLIDFDHQLSAR
ncbi:MAG TPA: hypothetical protein VK509_12075 [Polyangiales bacterium]|nr:hypothetical protein [Polyangiales bacterium]